MLSSGHGATARAPAWKRLGLKLKQSAAPEPANETLQVGHPSSRTQQSREDQSQSTPAKRKLDAPPTGASSSALKKPRNELHSSNANAQLKTKKSVTFGDTPIKNPQAHWPGNNTTTTTTTTTPQPKKSKGPAKKPAPPPTIDLRPALEYLQQWNSARDSWKFNKNHQSNLIKHAFDPAIFPAQEIDLFYAYIQDLKGFVRTRLRETAMEIRTKDSMEGAAGFPESSVNLGEKQLRYDALLADLLHAQTGQKRKAFHETQYRASSEDIDDIIMRIVKRMRAEMVLDQLSDGEETDTSRASSSTGIVSMADSDTTKATEGDKRMKLNDGTGKRRRKLRTNVDDSSSSSESDSDSDSNSSSSSSDDDDSDDDEMEVEDGYESSDSSSSSSSSSSDGGDEDSDSDDESADEEE